MYLARTMGRTVQNILSSIVFPHASHNLFPYTIFKFIINFMELEVVVARLLLFY